MQKKIGRKGKLPQRKPKQLKDFLSIIAALTTIIKNFHDIGIMVALTTIIQNLYDEFMK
jgi:hypothetical protein